RRAPSGPGPEPPAASPVHLRGLTPVGRRDTRRTRPATTKRAMASLEALRRRTLAAGVAFLAACGGGDGGGGGADAADADVPEGERSGGTAVIGMIGDIPDMNPLTSTDHNANQIQQFVLFTPLVAYDEDLEPVPY